MQEILNFYNGRLEVALEVATEPDNTGYPPYRVRAWENGKGPTVDTTFKGELGEMNAERLYNDITIKALYD